NDFQMYLSPVLKYEELRNQFLVLTLTRSELPGTLVSSYAMPLSESAHVRCTAATSPSLCLSYRHYVEFFVHFPNFHRDNIKLSLPENTRVDAFGSCLAALISFRFLLLSFNPFPITVKTWAENLLHDPWIPGEAGIFYKNTINQAIQMRLSGKWVDGVFLMSVMEILFASGLLSLTVMKQDLIYSHCGSVSVYPGSPGK
ncbi:hypothetical protein STEG23_036390, partial [Scotinomys teguina]